MATHQSTTIPCARELRAPRSTTLAKTLATTTTTASHPASQKTRNLRIGYCRPESRAAKRDTLLPPMPYLRLCGRWLEHAGFAIGQNVRIDASEGRLTIECID